MGYLGWVAEETVLGNWGNWAIGAGRSGGAGLGSMVGGAGETVLSTWGTGLLELEELD